MYAKQRLLDCLKDDIDKDIMYTSTKVLAAFPPLRRERQNKHSVAVNPEESPKLVALREVHYI